MFIVMDGQSLDTLETKEVPRVANTLVPGRVKTKNILSGSLKRSRNGCEPCRKRKKKCDEKRPVCGLCKHRNVKCVPKSKAKVTIKNNSFKVKVARPTPPPTNESTPITSTIASTTSFESDDILSQFPILPSSISASVPLSEPTTVSTVVHTPQVYDELFNFPLLRMPQSPEAMDLDGLGPMFLQGFIGKVTKTICIATDATNYYCKTFVQIAAIDKGVLYAIAAWGGLFIEGMTSTVKQYLTKAIKFHKQRSFATPPTFGKKELYILLSFYIVMMGTQVCMGDVCQWSRLLSDCVRLIGDHGGLRKICEMYHYSNDIKFLCSALSFHDLMSSSSFIKGPSFPIEHYLDIFQSEKLLELGNYGLDPLQGCIQPLYLLFGEISTVAAELRVQREEIMARFNTVADKKISAVYESSQQEFSLKLARIEYYENAAEQYSILQKKLEHCLPNAAQMEHIMNDEKELELHLTLFDVYVYTCQMCLNFQIKEMAPESFEMQKILSNAINCIDVLIDTKMVASLSLAILVCGITCSTDCDRREMEQRIAKVTRIYPVDNVIRIREVIREIWAINDNGKVCVDWALVCQNKGWELPVC